jgi:hypothetical protein
MAVLRTLSILLLALPALAAHAEIYKCSGKKGMPIYQNFSCETDSAGTPATSSSNAAPMAAPGPTEEARRTSVAAHTITAAGQARAASSIPRIGMTTHEVRSIWGEPRETSKEEFAKGDIETWTYADSRSIQFDRKGRVTAVR